MADLISAAVCNGSSLQLAHALSKFFRDVNRQTAFDAYPLHLAVWRNSVAAVHQLLDAGADANLQDGESGWSAVHKALHQGSLGVAALLLAHGGSMDVTDSKGRLPLDLVSRELKQQLLLAQQGSSAAAAAAGPGQARAAAEASVAGFSCLYSWGNGANLTLGTGSTDLHLTPVRVELHHPDAAAASSSSSGGSIISGPAAGTSGSSSSATGDSHAAAAAPSPAERIVAASAAKFHSAVVTGGGRLFTFGYGRGGRLGHADFHIHSGSSAQIFPRLVAGLGKRTVVAVAAAKHHTLVATSAGEVFSWGINKDGRLGYGAVDSQPTPRKVTGLPPRQRVVALAAANKHSAAVMCTGDVYTWGANASGQLGYGSSDSACNPTPRLVESLRGRRLVKVAAAKHHTVVLTADGEVFTFGHKVVTPRKRQCLGPLR
ncbi:hypothetical protein OEZ86_001947 [Tetradesmus obliquus]|nr:hypothetical protein OEZ86_001947 [Tetradesmus obliquus]